MNKMKKIVSLLLALVMAFALTATAFAGENKPGDGNVGGDTDPSYENNNDSESTDFQYNTSNNQDNKTQTPQGPQASGSTDCSITIEGAKDGHTYNAYQIFAGDLNTTTNEKGETVKTLSNIIWGDGISDAGKTALTAKYGSAAEAAKTLVTASDAEDFATMLVNSGYLKLSATMDRDDATGNYEADELSPGYYLIRDQYTAGANQDKNDAVSAYIMQVLGNETMKPKAETPPLDKSIVGVDEATKAKLDAVAAEVGKTVKFQLDSKVPEITGYTTKYVFTVTDTMSKGLTFDPASVKVTIDGVDKTADLFTVTPASVSGTPTENTEITIAADPEDFLAYIKDNDIKAGTDIVVTYSAKVNENALTTDVETNTAKLTYSNNPYDDTKTGETPEDTVYVYDFTIEIDKYDEKDNKKLAGAQFVLKNAEGKYYKWDDSAKKVTWVEEAAKNSAILITNNEGKLCVPETVEDKLVASTVTCDFKGLETGTYTLEEVQAPDGYNKVGGAYTIVIKDNATTTTDDEGKTVAVPATEYTITVTSWEKDEKGNAKVVGDPQTITIANHKGAPVTTQLSQEVQVPNNSGALLPETGGIGTTIFYIVGGVLAAGAVILLITKRRMNIDKD